MTNASASHRLAAPRKDSPSEVYELRKRAPIVYGTIDSGVINAGIINPLTTRGFMKIHGTLDEAWKVAAWSPNPSFDFVKIGPDVSGWTTLEPNSYNVWQAVSWQSSPVQVSGLLHDLGHRLLRVSNDPPFSGHEDIRTSNILIDSSRAETPFDPTPEEIRYKELNAKYYAGTLTPDEAAELTRIESELDDADAHDAQLGKLASKVEEGYDKLQIGLTRINGILDELLKN
jgi:hypothetical protein